MNLQAVFQTIVNDKREYSDVTILDFTSYKTNISSPLNILAIFTFNESPVKALQYANINSFLMFSTKDQHDTFLASHKVSAKS